GPHEGTRLVRSGAAQLRLAARIDGAGPALRYEICVLRDATYLSVLSEIVSDVAGEVRLQRTGTALSSFAADGQRTRDDSTIGPGDTALQRARYLKSPEAERVQRALAAIEVHVPPDTRRSWAVPQASATARSSNTARPVERLTPGGTNLVN